jgi:disulfide bond formation protein DsbB
VPFATPGAHVAYFGCCQCMSPLWERRRRLDEFQFLVSRSPVTPPRRRGVWQRLLVVHDTDVAFAALGVAGQAVVATLVLVALAAAVGIRAPLRALRGALWGYELWAAFVVAALATGGSLFFSEIAGYIPCELCWYQRICMYPLSLLTLFAAAHGDYRFARYLLPFPVVGAGVSTYHLLIENAVISEPSACRIGGAGCAVKWINEFGYVTIPTLALTGFLLMIGFLSLAAAGTDGEQATLSARA